MVKKNYKSPKMIEVEVNTDSLMQTASGQPATCPSECVSDCPTDCKLY